MCNTERFGKRTGGRDRERKSECFGTHSFFVSYLVFVGV
jgi:hypothetical protein